MYIDEEKVATRFKSLSLGAPDSARSGAEEEVEVEDQEGEELSLPRLNCSDEVKRVLAPKESAVRRLMREELSKPSKALVIWKPPVIGPDLPLTTYRVNNGNDNSGDVGDDDDDDNDNGTESQQGKNEAQPIEITETLEEDANEMMDL
jgi:hypothetical protein